MLFFNKNFKLMDDDNQSVSRINEIEANQFNYKINYLLMNSIIKLNIIEVSRSSSATIKCNVDNFLSKRIDYNEHD